MSYEDLAALIAGSHDIIDKANAAIPSTPYSSSSVSLSVGAGEDSVKITDWSPLTAERDLPPISREARFHYFWNATNPIADVSFTLSDGTRRVSVEGSDPAQVAALAEYLRNQLGKARTALGGPLFRMIGFFGFWLLAIVLPFALPNKSPISKVLGFTVPVSVPFIAFGLPWEVWLPGTAVVSGSASFVDRYANLLSVLGFFVALGTVLAAVVSRFRQYAAHLGAEEKK